MGGSTSGAAPLADARHNDALNLDGNEGFRQHIVELLHLFPARHEGVCGLVDLRPGVHNAEPVAVTDVPRRRLRQRGLRNTDCGRS